VIPHSPRNWRNC